MIKSCVVIGLGRIGMDYDINHRNNSAIYTHARAIAMHPAFKLEGAVDVSSEQRIRFEQHYCAPAFHRIDQALEKLQPDIVVIATPSKLHRTVLTQVTNIACPKLILCEKPLANSVEEARSIVQMCENFGIDLFVNYIRRTDPGAIEIKRRIDSGEISTPVKVNAWYSKGILNNGSHFLNLLEFWLGHMGAVKVFNKGRLWENHDPEPDFHLQFDLGSVIFRSAWEESFSHYGLELLSYSGRLRYDRGGEIIEWQGVCLDPKLDKYRGLTEKREVIANGMYNYQLNVYEQISKHMAGFATTLCTGRQALNTLEVIDSIIKQGEL